MQRNTKYTLIKKILPGVFSCLVGTTSFAIEQSHPSPMATISITPTVLAIEENSSGAVTITNTSNSKVSAENVFASIPANSLLTVSNTTCGTSLKVGASCTMTLNSGTAEKTNVAIKGSNTNEMTLTVNVTNDPRISIRRPTQQLRVVPVSGAPLDLTIQNRGQITANGITVTNKESCPELSVDDSNCTTVAPGAECVLKLSSNKPYAPCMISIQGSNTVNRRETLIAFSYLDGLVFQEGKVVSDLPQEFTSQWTNTFSYISGAMSIDDGYSNTNAIVTNAACASAPFQCAAQRCRNMGAEWYLPANNELTKVRSALCSNGTSPCNFGSFYPMVYSSSTQNNFYDAWYVTFPLGSTIWANKQFYLPVRCVKAYSN